MDTDYTFMSNSDVRKQSQHILFLSANDSRRASFASRRATLAFHPKPNKRERLSSRKLELRSALLTH